MCSARCISQVGVSRESYKRSSPLHSPLHSPLQPSSQSSSQPSETISQMPSESRPSRQPQPQPQVLRHLLHFNQALALTSLRASQCLTNVTEVRRPHSSSATKFKLALHKKCLISLTLVLDMSFFLKVLKMDSYWWEKRNIHLTKTKGAILL